MNAVTKYLLAAALIGTLSAPNKVKAEYILLPEEPKVIRDRAAQRERQKRHNPRRKR